MTVIIYRKKKKEINEFRAVSIVKEYIPRLQEALLIEVNTLIELLERMRIQVEKNGKISHGYKKKTVFDILKVGYNYTFEIAA